MHELFAGSQDRHGAVNVASRRFAVAYVVRKPPARVSLKDGLAFDLPRCPAGRGIALRSASFSAVGRPLPFAGVDRKLSEA